MGRLMAQQKQTFLSAEQAAAGVSNPINMAAINWKSNCSQRPGTRSKESVEHEQASRIPSRQGSNPRRDWRICVVLHAAPA